VKEDTLVRMIRVLDEAGLEVVSVTMKEQSTLFGTTVDYDVKVSRKVEQTEEIER